MDHFAGLDVSVKETSVCIVDDTGKIVREVKVASEPNALLAVLKNPAYHFKRIGLEAGPLSQRLCSALAEAELPVVCVETRHADILPEDTSYAWIAHIGGVTPSRPTLIAGAVIVPSGIFCPATMKICAPGLRSSRLPETNRTTGVSGTYTREPRSSPASK